MTPSIAPSKDPKDPDALRRDPARNPEQAGEREPGRGKWPMRGFPQERSKGLLRRRASEGI